jgi:hypothetical protein
MFGKIFKKNTPPDAEANAVESASTYLTARLNARVQPMHRGELFEDPLDEALQELGIGSVTGGGTQLSESGEVDYCDIEIDVAALDERSVQAIINLLEGLGAPHGSKLKAGEQELPFGNTEGLALYLNGTDLPDEVYKACDSNVVYTEVQRLIGDRGEIYSHWQGPKETALYLYGNSFQEMRDSIAEFLATYPLCQKCRVEQIA